MSARQQTEKTNPVLASGPGGRRLRFEEHDKLIPLTTDAQDFGVMETDVPFIEAAHGIGNR